MTQKDTLKWIYSFGNGRAEGDANMRQLLGGKGANLAEMNLLGLSVPPGFTITTDVCNYYYEHEKTYPKTLDTQINAYMAMVEEETEMQFGSIDNPLLVSVRSGAPASMPGMMDTILNLGLNDQTVQGLIKQSNDERFAYDSYRRFIQMFSSVVLGVEHYRFEEALEEYKREYRRTEDTDLDAKNWQEIIDIYKNIVSNATHKEFPQDPIEQLHMAINAVFDSWHNPRAKTYRKLNKIPKEWGTAVNVQAMVFGNMGDDCATGVAFTRCPSTGNNYFFGEYLVNAQGEDVVAGIRTPYPINKESNNGDHTSLEEKFPSLYNELMEVREKLENHYRDMQDIEFTIQKGKLYMLQTRAGKRTTEAAIKIAIDMAEEKLITHEEAVLRVNPASIDQLLHPTLDPESSKILIAQGLPASPGAACGEVIFCADEAEKLSNMGRDVILCRTETSPDDIHGMHAAKGILTCRGGMTSHAAVVARGIGRPCIAGATECQIDFNKQEMYCGTHTIKKGEHITIDGALGYIYQGEIQTIEAELSDNFTTLMKWADDARHLKVRTNAETPAETQVAVDFGAEGIGLCRTEHMFFDPDRLPAMQEMILANSHDDRQAALHKILPMQRHDFIDIFNIMDDRPVTIRLLDPPLHEFLPKTKAEMSILAKNIGCNIALIEQRAEQLHEINPMLGHRGCRLGITYPEIYDIQVQAIFEAVIHCVKHEKLKVIPEIMIPLVSHEKELKILRKRIDEMASNMMTENKLKFSYQVGTMIELPRAALRAKQIAEFADFFSFGTNDLTQTTYGMSRDDSNAFIADYERLGIFKRDPFASLDQSGVGELIMLAKERGTGTKSDLKLGICGEHGGDPDSIDFCHRAGLEYVSCSPYRVPIARLAAAQAALREKTLASSNKKNKKAVA